MKIYEIVNMYNFHFDRRFYFENKTTFIEFLLMRPGHSRQNFVLGFDTTIVITMHALKHKLNIVDWCGRTHNLVNISVLCVMVEL